MKKKTRGENIKRITALSLLTALSLIIFVIESMIPPISPIPGIKLGLANVITLFLIITADPKSSLAVLLARITLAAIFAGQAVSFFYSLCGGLLAWAAMCISSRILNKKPVWFISAAGAIFHNIGQITAAAVLMTKAALVYLPYLLISGCITGVLTGLLTDFTIEKMKKSGLLDKLSYTVTTKRKDNM